MPNGGRACDHDTLTVPLVPAVAEACEGLAHEGNVNGHGVAGGRQGRHAPASEGRQKANISWNCSRRMFF
jgi:hypothetical protein